MARKLSGAALYSKIEQQLRDEWLTGYGLPLERYSFEVTYVDEFTLNAKFTHKDSEATIVIDAIWYGDDGHINQMGEMALS